MYFDFHHHKKNYFGIYNFSLLETVPECLFSVGIHPKNIDDNFEKNFEKIKKLSQSPNCIAIGECGLDGLIGIDENIQNKVFEEHIKWANEIRKPVIIHCVRKFSEILKFNKIAQVPMIIHGFNKKNSLANELLAKGFHLSFGKAVLQNVSLQQTLKGFPLKKMFLETDDADFDISELYHKVSEIKDISLESLQNQILENLETIRKI